MLYVCAQNNAAIVINASVPSLFVVTQIGSTKFATLGSMPSFSEQSFKRNGKAAALQQNKSVRASTGFARIFASQHSTLEQQMR